MAEMLPPELRHSRKRSAEKRFFELVRPGLGADWTVLHSFEVARAKGKKWAEIDFVLIGPEGVFCIEVKGGQVERSAGVWLSTDRDGHQSEIKDPYAQAREAYAEMERVVRNQLGLPERVLVGYGVSFPQCMFRESFDAKGWPPDLPDTITIDASATPQEIQGWITRLETFARETPGARMSRRLTGELRDRIVDGLRPDFIAPVALGPYFHEIERDLGEAARIQFRSASGAIRDVDRAIVLGGPGTGKSVLAIEEAAFQGGLARDGLSVVLTCYNHALAQFLGAKLSDRAPYVRVQTLHDLMRDVVAASDLSDSLADEEALTDDERRRYFAIELPTLATRALTDPEAGFLGARAHALVIDEGQDLLSEPFVRFVDALLEDGIAGGRWKLFLDRGQDAYRAYDEDSYRLFEASRDSGYTLQFNCRNADEVAAGVTELVGDGICRTEALVPGGFVDWRYFGWENSDDQSKQLTLVVEELLAKGVRLEQIMVLSPYRFEKSRAVQGYAGTLPLWDVSQGVSEADHLAFSTIYKFKGLEADAVVLLDVTAGLRNRDRAILRVGASRARAHLTVLLETQLHPVIEEAVAEHSEHCPNHPNSSGGSP